MATWDFGGGCPCGVSKVCDCKLSDKAIKQTKKEDKKAFDEWYKGLFDEWHVDNKKELFAAWNQVRKNSTLTNAEIASVFGSVATAIKNVKW